MSIPSIGLGIGNIKKQRELYWNELLNSQKALFPNIDVKNSKKIKNVHILRLTQPTKTVTPPPH